MPNWISVHEFEKTWCDEPECVSEEGKFEIGEDLIFCKEHFEKFVKECQQALAEG